MTLVRPFTGLDAPLRSRTRLIADVVVLLGAGCSAFVTTPLGCAEQ